MLNIDITKMVPHFILNDKNGYALAKAMEAGAQMANDIVEQGVRLIIDYDTMPEWRLDELAWETNCLYDYSAGIEEKREWIKSADPWYRTYGTKEAIARIAEIVLGDGKVEEWFEYGGEPFHFKIKTKAILTKENRIRFLQMLEKAKNVRSRLQEIEAERKNSIAGYVAVAYVLNPHFVIQCEEINCIYLKQFVGMSHVAVQNIIILT